MAQALTDLEVLRELESIAREKLEWGGELRAEMRLAEDLQWDSLQLMGFAIETENRFRIKLNPDEEASIETVGDLVRLVSSKSERVGRNEPTDVDP